MEKKRDFSILKWIVFPSMSVALAAIVSWFNITVFGWKDGAFYLVAVGLIAAFSIAINRYIGSDQNGLAIAAFIFEILLMVALAGNAIYSLSIQRKMAVARHSEQNNVEVIREAKQLKSRSAQREAIQMVHGERKGAESSDSIFAKHEFPLLVIMGVELAAYILAAFTLLAISHLAYRSGKEMERGLKEVEESDRKWQARPAPSPAPVMAARRPLVRPSTIPVVPAKHEGVKGKGNGMDVGK